MARELDDAILLLRTNEPDIGLWLLKTEGDVEQMLEMDTLLRRYSTDWLVQEAMVMGNLIRVGITPLLKGISDTRTNRSGTVRATAMILFPMSIARFDPSRPTQDKIRA